MRIAICDDNTEELEGLAKLLEAYREKTKASFTCKTYSDGVSLLEDARRKGFDFLILDVMMPLMNGMQVAHEVRAFDENLKIAFLTSSPEFAVESYSVEAFAYILKPAAADNLFPVLDNCSTTRKGRRNACVSSFKTVLPISCFLGSPM
jgi:DNA-binding LytR/AlgR family response regulator